MKKENLPIGALIVQELDKQDHSRRWLAKKVVYNHSTICKTLKRDHIDTALLVRISRVLNYDFFADYSAYLKGSQ